MDWLNRFLGQLNGPLRLGLILGVIALLLAWLIDDPFWALVIVLVIMAIAVPYVTKYTRPYTADLVNDAFTGNLRWLRRGLNWIAPGEVVEDTINLQTDIKGIEKETYPSKAGKVLGRYVYGMVPDASTDESLTTFRSFTQDAIKTAAHALFSMKLSDYFRNKLEDDDILDKAKINGLLFGEGDDMKDDVRRFAKKHGVRINEIRLEDVDFDAKVQSYRDTVAGAKSFREGFELLKANRGLDDAEASKIMRLLMDQAQEFIITAPDLKNMRDVTILGGIPGKGGDKKKGKKKGDEK